MANKRALLNPHPSSQSLIQNIWKEFDWVQQKLWIKLSILSGLDNSRRSTSLSTKTPSSKAKKLTLDSYQKQ